MDLSITIKETTFPNPVFTASGTFGYGSEYEELIPIDKLGAIITKAVTLNNKPGNDIPRIVETPSGLINSIGLANPGLNTFIKEKVPALSALPCPVMVNVAGDKEEDYIEVVKTLNGYDAVDAFEINISCPNVKKGGMSFGTDPQLVQSLTEKLKNATHKPLIVKLTPNVTDITVIAGAAEKGGADALSCINTLVGMVIDTKTGKPVLPGGTGGLSGPAIRPAGVAAVYKVSRAVSIPVIGLGGIMNADDAIQYLLAGASAIQIGTANFVNPETALSVLKGIEEYAYSKGFNCIKDFH